MLVACPSAAAATTWRVLTVAMLQACAQPADQVPADGESGSGRPVILSLADPASAPAALPQLTDRLAAAAGVPVQGLVRLSPTQLKLTLVCADLTACDRAMQRLADERSLVAGIAADVKRKRPTRPPPSSSSSR